VAFLSCSETWEGQPRREKSSRQVPQPWDRKKAPSVIHRPGGGPPTATCTLQTWDLVELDQLPSHRRKTWQILICGRGDLAAKKLSASCPAMGQGIIHRPGDEPPTVPGSIPPAHCKSETLSCQLDCLGCVSALNITFHASVWPRHRPRIRAWLIRLIVPSVANAEHQMPQRWYDLPPWHSHLPAWHH
jgi:hypothetical protein